MSNHQYDRAKRLKWQVEVAECLVITSDEVIQDKLQGLLGNQEKFGFSLLR